jgi:hypothetical protein
MLLPDGDSTRVRRQWPLAQREAKVCGCASGPALRNREGYRVFSDIRQCGQLAEMAIPYSWILR